MTDATLADTVAPTPQTAPAPRPRRANPLPLKWLGVAPFMIFALLFLILPTIHIVLGAFQTPEGDFTLRNLQGLGVP